MTAKILDGKAIAALEKAKLKQSVKDLYEKQAIRPGLAVILVGQNPASQIYVQKKREACEELGFLSEMYHLPIEVTESELLSQIKSLNANPDIHGILVQLPLPAHIQTDTVLDTIDPQKDVDGFHAFNLGKLAQNKTALFPCTPSGIMTMLSYTDINLIGLKACVIGASNIVGRPMALALLNQRATVTICNSKTPNLPAFVQNADLVVAAIGRPEAIQGEWIAPNAVVIDVGINRLDNGKLTGDVAFDQAKTKASWITPVPGGVGPMTVCALMKNTLKACLSQKGL